MQTMLTFMFNYRVNETTVCLEKKTRDVKTNECSLVSCVSRWI